MMRRITLIFSVLLILFSLTVFPTAPASAAVRRCDATYEWQTTGGSIGPIRFGEFTARGDCGDGVPNRCRKRAREAAKKCIGTQWEKRWQHYSGTPNFDPNPPEACLEAAKIEGYDLTTVARDLSLGSKGDIKTALDAEVCCKYNQGGFQFIDNKNVYVRLSARTSSSSGNKNCRSNNIPISDNYRINCTWVRKNICPF